MKQTIFFILFLLFSGVVTALDECKGTMDSNDIPCSVILPVNTTSTACDTLEVHFYNESTSIYNSTMSQNNYFSCNATFNQTLWGTYTFLYSTGDSGSIVVETERNNIFYLYTIAMIAFLVLLWLGYYLEEPAFQIIAGMLSAVMAVNLIRNGFPTLTNTFLQTSIVIVLSGVGFYFIVAPTIEWFQKHFGVGGE